MNNRSYIIQVCLSILQSLLGAFTAFFVLDVFLENSSMSFNDCILDALAKSFLICCGLVLAWQLGQRNKKRGKEEEKVVSSSFSWNMMISNISTSVFCLLVWLLCWLFRPDVHCGKTLILLLVVFTLSIVITVAMTILRFNSKKHQ